MDEKSDLPDYNRMDIMLPWKDGECVIKSYDFPSLKEKIAASVTNSIIRKLTNSK